MATGRYFDGVCASGTALVYPEMDMSLAIRRLGMGDIVGQSKILGKGEINLN